MIATKKKTRLAHFLKATRVAAARAVREYAKEDGMLRSDYADTVRSLREGFARGLDWFLVWDAIGTRDNKFFDENEGIVELYHFAERRALRR